MYINTTKPQKNPLRIERGTAVNALIDIIFSQSKDHFSGIEKGQFAAKTTIVIPPMIPYDNNVPIRKKKVPGHAVCCFIQGLSLRNNTTYPQEFLKKICTKLKNYFENEESVPMLFDDHGLRRAYDVQEVFETLARGSIATCLFNHYKFGTAFTYVNAVGFAEDGIVIDDPLRGKIQLTFSEFVKSIHRVWIW